LGGAFAAQYINAVSPKPLFNLGLIYEPIGIHIRRQGLNHLAGNNMFGVMIGGAFVASSATPLFTMLGNEKLLAASRRCSAGLGFVSL
jgi:hypothetical protein